MNITNQIKISLFFVLIILALIAGWHFWPRPDANPKPSDQGAVEIEREPITIGSDETPSLPSGFTPRAGDKIITIRAIRDIPAGKEIKVLVPQKDPSYVLSDSGRAIVGSDSSLVVVTEQEFRNPFLEFKPHIMVGIGISFSGPTPMGGVSLLTVGSKFHLGGMVDKYGAGAFGSFEFAREFNVAGKYNVISFDSPVRWTVGIVYRF